jgi:ribonucleoside-diphosphate reductase alpha chain
MGISCHKKYGYGSDATLSCADGLSKAIRKALDQSTNSPVIKRQMTIEDYLERAEVEYESGNGACPECGSQMEYSEGCSKCTACGYSECG